MRRRAVACALAAVLIASGCGSSDDDDNPAPTEAGPAPSAQQQPTPLEPRGRLTTAEYASLRGGIDRLERLDGVSDAARLHRGLARACRGLAKPRTSIVVSVRRECAAWVGWARAIRDALRRLPRCQGAISQGDVSCLTGSADAMGRGAHRAAVAARKTRRAVGRRRIRGDCARAMVTSQGDIRGMLEFERSMRSASQALTAKNVAELRTAQARLDDLDFSDEDLSRLIRRCRRA